MRLRKHSYYFSLSILILLLLMTGALAQGGGQNGDRVRIELERNDQWLERAREAVMTVDNPVAERLLQRAEELQEMAWDDYRDGQLASALLLGRQAREKAKEAMAAARKTQQSDAVVLRHLERAGELLDQAGERIRELDRDGLEAMYETARENLDQAWEFYRNGQYRPALKLAEQIETVARKLLSTAGDDQRSHEQFRRRLEATNRLLLQTRDMTADCDIPQVEQLLKQADASIKMAEEMFRNGQPEPGLKALAKARDLIKRASRLCQGIDHLKRFYERLLKMHERISEDASGMGDAPRMLLDQAKEQLELARGYLDDEQIKPAAAALRATQLALRQAQQYIDDRR